MGKIDGPKKLTQYFITAENTEDNPEYDLLRNPGKQRSHPVPAVEKLAYKD